MSGLLVLDNYDSFTYNLVQLLRELGTDQPEVRRNDKISLTEAAGFDRIVLSPGPGLPREAGIMPELVRELAPTKKILGICLGHQCIGEVFGAKLHNMTTVVHGKAVEAQLLNEEESLFAGLPERIMVGRYHSWVVDREGFPPSLKISAVADGGLIMALAHREFAVKGLQFHPESVLTPRGADIIRNWLSD